MSSKHRIVRDIAWAVESPPLLLPRGDHRFPKQQWFNKEYRALAPALDALNNNSKELHQLDAMASSLRLGGYFEQLILWWVQHSPNYELLAHDLQVHDKGITKGAFDLIVRCLNDNVIEHWELACKFYLQDGPSNHLSSWVGPARKDKLELKYQHLLSHQIALSNSAAGVAALEEKGWTVERHKIIVKGRLFGADAALPDDCNPNALRGWLSVGNMPVSNKLPGGHLPLQREHWMSPIIEGDIQRPDANTAHRHGCLCVAEMANGAEKTRGFIVPESWHGST